MKNKISLAGFILLCEAVGIAGAYFTRDAIPNWYATINQPFFTPPNWLFGPVWTLLYAMMGIVAFMLWQKRQEKESAFALKVFFVQLALNGIWTPIFFGLKNLELALVVIVLMWVAIAYLIFLLWKIKKVAAWLLIPYIVWVSYATALNAAFVMLN